MSSSSPQETQVISLTSNPTPPPANSKQELFAGMGAACALALLPLVYFFPAVLSNTALMPGDGWTQNIGVRLLVGRMLSHGFLPLWNPYMFGGTPLLASAYPGVLYPPNWLFAVAPYDLAMNVVVITTYHIALIGTYLYVRRLGANRIAGLVAGITYAFCGYMVTHLGHTPRIAAAAWVPWVMLAFEGLFQRLAWRWVCLGAVAIALELFASEPQVTVYNLMMAVAYVLFSALLREPKPARLRFLASAALTVLLGLMLGALQLLPSMEQLRVGHRATLDYDYFSASSLPPAHLLTFIYPYFFGGMAMVPYRVEYWSVSWLSEVGGYAGVLSLLLALVALTARRNRVAIFWALFLGIAFVLSFGDYLPFHLNHLLFRVPFYNKFRVSARHIMEVGFALAVLAALGVQALASLELVARQRALKISSTIFVALFAVTAICYNWRQSSFHAERNRPANAALWTNPEQLIPWALCLLSLLVVWCYAHRPRAVAGFCLVVLMLLDVASFGFFFEWREKTFANAPLTDPPSVAAIKAREKDRNSYRMISHAKDLFGDNALLLNATNVSQMRGVQTVQGFDVLMSNRHSQLLGDMDDTGVVNDVGLFSKSHQGLNLLNVKYLLYEAPLTVTPDKTEMLGDWRFSKTPLSLRFPMETQFTLSGSGAWATKFALVSALGLAVEQADGSPLAKVRLHTTEGKVIERDLLIGRDSAEQNWDHPDIRQVVKHRQPKIARTWQEGKFDSHEYLTEFSFPRAAIDRIEIIYTAKAQANSAYSEDGLPRWEVTRAALLDETTGQDYFPSPYLLEAERWRKLERFGEVELYENLKVLPRAWFVKELKVLPRPAVLQTIKEGKFSDGATYDPATTGLLEKEDFGNRDVTLPAMGEDPQAKAQVTLYEPNRLSLVTENTQAGFLILSENYYRGWEAWVDGVRVPVERVNYVLRGVAVPAGKHRIHFRFRSPSVRVGATYFAVGASLLVLGAIISGVRQRRRR